MSGGTSRPEAKYEFTGFKTAAAGELPEAVEVLNPFFVVKLWFRDVGKVRQWVQRELHRWRGLKDDPLSKVRCMLGVGLGLAMKKQKTRLEDLFKTPEREPVQLVWSVYQRMVDACCQPKLEVGKWALSLLIEEIGAKVPAGCRS